MNRLYVSQEKSEEIQNAARAIRAARNAERKAVETALSKGLSKCK